MRRAAAAALILASLLAGCARTTPGQVAMTTEPLSPEMTCGEFVTLSNTDRVKAVSTILAKQSGESSEKQAIILSALAGVLCTGMPEAPLKEVLGRMKVR